MKDNIILESNNDPSYSMYIVSDDYLGDKKKVNPKIPRDTFTKKGIKNDEVERVPFYPSIKQALIAAGDGVNEKREMFVHVPIEGQKVKAQKPTSKDVPDIANTGEIWVKEPIEVKCIGKIRIGKQLREVSFEVDGKTYNEFTWNYSWLTKQNQNVMNDMTDKEGDTEDISDIKKDKVEEACKDLATARKFVSDVQKTAKKYNANFFMVTDGASGYSNGNGTSNPAVKNARNQQIEWEKQNGFDPDEDWSDKVEESAEFDTKLSKDDVLNLLKKLNKYPRSEFVLCYKAALVLYGVVDKCNDVDLDITEKLGDMLLKDGYEESVSKLGSRRFEINERLECFVMPDFNKIKKTKIDGYLVYDIHHILDEYKRRNRPKDQATIKAIEEFLNKKVEESTTISELSLPKIVVPNKLYHGSCNKFDYLLASGIDLGNSLQKPGWSLYTWKSYEDAIGWAVFATIKEKMYKYFDYELKGCYRSSVTVLSSHSYDSLISNLNRIPVADKTFYVYTVDTRGKNYEYGLGHSSNTPNCITIRTNEIIPYAKVDSKVITKEIIDKYCDIRDDDITDKDYGVNARLTSFLMNHDMMYNISVKKELSKAINKDGTLSVGDDIISFMKSHGLKFEDISFMNRLKDMMNESAEIEYLTEDALWELPGTLDTGDRLILFGEDAKYDTQLKRLLYNSRLKQRKELLEIYDKVKTDIPWIRYTFPDIAKYQHRNIFVDTYYYTQVFFSNNTWALKKGLGLYLEFMSRLLHNKNVDHAGYKKKTIMIPVLDWDKHHDGSVWNYRVSLNPISAMYQLMFTTDLRQLRNIFGDIDIIFVASNRYFKINFNEIPDKESKKYADKFKRFLIKLCRNEQFDVEDIDTTGEFNDSPEVVQAKIVDKIEDSKGVDITPELHKAKQNISKPTNTKKVEDKKPVEDTNKTLGSISKSDKDKIKDDNQEKKDNIAKFIASQTTNTNTQEDDVFAAADDKLKLDLLTLEPDDDAINISASRAARMSELDKKVLETRVKGKTVDDILSSTKSKEVVKTKLNISDPEEEYQDLTFVNFDKNYDVDKDIIACFRHFANTSIPIVIRDIQVTDNSTSEDRVELYRVEMEDYMGKRFTIKLDIPIMKDNRFLLRGNTKAIQTQLYTMPILKVDLNSAQIVSNYSKIILTRFKAGNGRSLPLTAKMLKAIEKYKGTKVKFITGDNTKVCNKYDLPIDYIDFAGSLSKIESKDFVFYLNQDEIRKAYDIDDSQGIPIGYDKKASIVIYLSKDVPSTFTNIVYTYIINIDKSYEELCNSATRPSACTYSRAKIMSVEIPVIVICAYHEGLRATLDKAAIKYELVDKLSVEVRNNPSKDWIKFSDGYVIYDVTQESSLLLNGLKDCATEYFSINEIDNKNMYLEFLDNYGGRIKADGLDNFYNLMMDPMTVESLRYYHLPTDYIQTLIYANNLLADNKFIRHTETATKRFRRAQLIAVYTYKVLSSAYSAYANQVKHGAAGIAKMMVKQSDVIDAFLADSITADDSTINALRDIETTNSVTTKGPSGMNSPRAYSLDKRTYDDSMLNVFGISTGFASNVGITRQATLNANVTPEGYTKVINGDTTKMNTVNTLTATEALTPFGSTHDDPMRTAMTFIQTAKHQVRTVDSDPALVTNGADEAMPYMSSDRFAFKAKHDGKIIELTDEYALIQYDNGEKDLVNLMEVIEKNSDGGYHVPLKLDINKGIKVGSRVKANDIIAYDKESYSNNLGETGNLAYNIGKLAKVAVINSDEGFEDSGIITESLAKKLATRINYQFSVILDKDTIVYDIAKVGQHVEAGEPLLTYQKPFTDEDANAIIKAMSTNSDKVSELGKKTLDSHVTGTVKGIKIFRTVELDELSDSLRKIVDDYERPLKRMQKIIDDNNLDKSIVPAHYKLATEGKLKKAEDSVLVEIYVEYLDTVGVGDKIVAFAANKMVIKDLIPQELAPYTDSRPNEPIEAFISESAIDHRLIASTLVIGSISHLMVELDRSVKDLMGIDYDDSSL